MKTSVILLVLWSLSPPLWAEDAETEKPKISGPVADGTPSQPAAKPTLPAFEIEHTTLRRLRVEENSELPGLPSVKGTITVKLLQVKEPHLPDPPLPLPPLPVDDPAVQARMAEARQNHHDSRYAFVSATVHDHSRTFLRIYPGGKAGNGFSAWSNVDFNHFSGFASYQVKNADGTVTDYSLIMAVGPSGNGSEKIAPIGAALPDLADGGPAYTVTEGGTSDDEGMQIIDGMHELYRVEGNRMKAAYHARIAAYEERKAYLLANPPTPKDVTIHFWKRSAPATTQSNNEEGQGQ